MDCPKCVGRLSEMKAEGETVDVCFACEGIWFDKQELHKVIAADRTNFKTLGLEHHSIDGAETAGHAGHLNQKEGHCPRCGGLMEHSLFKGAVTVDSCKKGCGVWLDGGEVHKVRSKEPTLLELLKLALTKEGFQMFLEGLKQRKG